MTEAHGAPERCPLFVSSRVVPCERCGGDKGWDVPYDIDYRDGGTIDRWVPCTACDETGEIEVEDEPIEMEDLP